MTIAIASGNTPATVQGVTYDTMPSSTVITHAGYVRAVLDHLASDEAVRAATGDELYFTPAPVPAGMPVELADLLEAYVLENERAAREMVFGFSQAGAAG